MEDLNDLIPAGSGWVLVEARGINYRGQIVGTGSINGHAHAFLLTPEITAVPAPPASPWLPSALYSWSVSAGCVSKAAGSVLLGANRPSKWHTRRAEAVLVLLVDVPRAWLRKNRKGLWYSVRDVPADRIRRVLSFAELAGASAA